MRVLVTGASGFIGSHLRAALAGQRCDIRALVLDGESVPGSASVCWRGADDRAAIDTATRGVDAVVHLAARAHVMEDPEPDALAAYRRVNVDGTQAVAESAAAARVKSFVFISSVKAVGNATEIPWTRTTVAKPTDPYGMSKREAEEIVERIAASSGMCATILRFPLVYGPGMRANMLRLFDLVNAGMPVPVGKSSRRSMIFVGNAVAAIETVLKDPERAAGSWFVTDGVDLRTADLVRGIAAALGRPARVLGLPRILLSGAGRLGDLLSRAVRCPINSEVVRRLCESLVVDNDEFGRATGFRAPYTVTEALRLTAEWYQRRPA